MFSVFEDVRDWFRRPRAALPQPWSRAIASAQPTPLCFIADDELGVRHFLTTLIESHDVATHSFSDANSLLAAFIRQRPDLIFLDVSLERSDAIEVIRGLADGGYKGAVQLVSGRGAEILNNVKRIGERRSLRMLPVLEKPLRPDDIKIVLEKEHLIGWRAAASISVDLSDALDRGWVEMWYQPKIDLRRKVLSGAEALARIKHPQHGIVLPGSFLPGASAETLYELTEFALATTLHDWCGIDQICPGLQLAVNVPAAALPKLPVPALLREFGPRNPNWAGLTLEVTEDEIIKDVPLAFEIATQMRIHGVNLSIDDFGAGYSSLARLKELPFSELKLNRSFVDGCNTDEKNSAICQMVIDLAHRFGSVVVGEGIEARADLQALMAMGCDFGQGFLLARPMDKQSFISVLNQRAERVRLSNQQSLALHPQPLGVD
jgi:EAL domain-containing protein (putative c-di-GMP-specific phosphodiesterase class I)